MSHVESPEADHGNWGEFAIVIGKRGKDIPAAKIRDYVWGVTRYFMTGASVTVAARTAW
jgi:hypothetical protein